MNKRALRAEIRRLNDILERGSVPVQKRDALTPVIENTAWLRLRLDEVRKEMTDEPIVCQYDNGGGQKGTRQNPLYKSYVELYKAYLQGFKTYLDVLPAALQEEAKAEDTSVLNKIITMKQKRANA